MNLLGVKMESTPQFWQFSTAEHDFLGPPIFRQAEILYMGKSHEKNVEFLKSRRTGMIFCLIHPIAINNRKQLLSNYCINSIINSI